MQCRRLSSHCCWMQGGLEENSTAARGGGGQQGTWVLPPPPRLASTPCSAQLSSLRAPEESGSPPRLPVPPDTPKIDVPGPGASHPIGQSLQDKAAASSRPSTELRWAHDVLTGTRTDSSTQVSVPPGKITNQSQTALKIHSKPSNSKQRKWSVEHWEQIRSEPKEALRPPRPTGHTRFSSTTELLDISRGIVSPPPAKNRRIC